MSGDTPEAPVLIAGAGPVGMTAALALNARGVDATILEAEPEDRDRSGSRAIYVHGSTLRTLERVKKLLTHGTGRSMTANNKPCATAVR